MLNLQIALWAIILLTGLLHYENSQNIKGRLSAKILLSSLFILAILVQPHAITYYYQFLLAGMIRIPSSCKKNSPKTKNRPWLKIILCLLWLPVMLPFGCASGITGNSDEIDFNTITVLSDWTKSGTVRLTDGEYRKSTAPDSSTNIVVKLTDKKVAARINGKDTAAVILATDPGGSGTFFDLALLVKGTDGWENTDLVLLGDRIRVHSIAVENDIIVVDMTTHGPDEPMCCPTHRIVKRFTIQGNLLAEVPAESAGAVNNGSTNLKAPNTIDAQIIGHVWKWQQTLYNNDTGAVPSKPEHFTLQLQPNGHVLIQADCNKGGGVYTLKDSRLTIEITHSSLAACPPGSPDEQFVKDLNAASIVFIKQDKLFIDLKYDTGTMTFAK